MTLCSLTFIYTVWGIIYPHIIISSCSSDCVTVCPPPLQWVFIWHISICIPVSLHSPFVYPCVCSGQSSKSEMIHTLRMYLHDPIYMFEYIVCNISVELIRISCIKSLHKLNYYIIKTFNPCYVFVSCLSHWKLFFTATRVIRVLCAILVGFTIFFIVLFCAFIKLF